MKFTAKLFIAGILFFIPLGVGYGVWSDGEPVGMLGLPLLGGLVGMIGGYLWLVSRRVDPDPADDPHGEISDGAGEQGQFSPWSWWPLAVAASAAIAFAGLAVGWWLFGVGVAVGVVALVGWVFEFSRGKHAH